MLRAVVFRYLVYVDNENGRLEKFTSYPFTESCEEKAQIFTKQQMKNAIQAVTIGSLYCKCPHFAISHKMYFVPSAAIFTCTQKLL